MGYRKFYIKWKYKIIFILWKKGGRKNKRGREEGKEKWIKERRRKNKRKNKWMDKLSFNVKVEKIV